MPPEAGGSAGGDGPPPDVDPLSVRGGEVWKEEVGGPRLSSDRLVVGEETFVLVLSSWTEDAASVSPLSFLPDMLEASLGFRCWRPMRPSFSIATKLVRTLERGRGDSVPAETDKTS